MLGIINDVDQVSKKYPSRGSRAEMEKYEHLLPHYVKDELKKGKLHYADTIIYSVKPLDSKTVKMFLPQDDKQIGLRNISNGKLPKNQCLLVSAIWVTATSTIDDTVDEITSATFDTPEHMNALMNGEFSLKANQDYIVPETSCMVFRSGQLNPVGYYKLDNPRLIIDQVPIEFTFELASLKWLFPHTYVMVGLKGTITTP